MSDKLPPIEFPRPVRRGLPAGTLISLGVVLLLLAGAGWYLYPRFRPTTYHLTMTTGSFSGANYLLATQYLVPAAKAEGVDLEFVQTGGSEDTLAQVQKGAVQVAMTDGGLGTKDRDNVREIAPLFISGMHLLMKKELYQQAIATGDLASVVKGKRVSLSNVGSGTRIFALVLLQELGVAPTDIIDDPKTVNFLVDPKTTVDQVPDVVFAASLLPSPVAQRLVTDFDYRLYPLDFVDALRLSDKAAYAIDVPAGAYDFSPLRPPTKVTTVGRRILLVANKDVPDEAVFRLAKAVFESDFSRAYDPPLTTKQFDLIAEYPRHPGALEYEESQKPVTQEAIANIVLYLTGISALVVCMPLFVFLRGLLRKVRFGRRLASVNDYFVLVSDLEAESQEIEEAATPAAAYETRRHLRRRLSQLKFDALERYRNGLFEDPEHLENLLAHISDARIHLNAVIGASATAAPSASPNGQPRPGDDLLSPELKPVETRA